MTGATAFEYLVYADREKTAYSLDPCAPGSLHTRAVTSALRGMSRGQLLQVAVEALARLGHHRPAAPSEIVTSHGGGYGAGDRPAGDGLLGQAGPGHHPLQDTSLEDLLETLTWGGLS